jgi:RNase P subunit RPR2
MTTEYDLSCADCDGPLARETVAPEELHVDATGPVPVATCQQCGSRHYPDEALDVIEQEAS